MIFLVLFSHLLTGLVGVFLEAREMGGRVPSATDLEEDHERVRELHSELDVPGDCTRRGQRVGPIPLQSPDKQDTVKPRGHEEVRGNL